VEIQPFAGKHPIRVLCTTGQVADLVRQLGGEHVQVETLMGPGIDPHSYKALPSDMDKLSQSDAVFYNGLHLEGRLGDTLERFSHQKPTIAITQGLVEAKDSRLRMAPEFQGNYDPHVWHDPSLWADCAAYVAGKLATFDPPHADDYRQNLADLRKQLNELHAFCRQELATIPKEQRVLVTSHDAFWYLGNAYGMEVHGLQGISTADEIDLGKIDQIVHLLVDRQIQAAFIESAVAPRTIRAVIEQCRERGHAVENGGELFADALGPPGTSAETYDGMMRANVRTIVEALR
jgi:manganese/zinc/iron transport system substrate-binding protein